MAKRPWKRLRNNRLKDARQRAENLIAMIDWVLAEDDKPAMILESVMNSEVVHIPREIKAALACQREIDREKGGQG